VRAAIVCLLGCVTLIGCSSPLKEIRRAQTSGNVNALVEMVSEGDYRYVRERAARALRHARSSGAQRAAAVPTLLACVQSKEEVRYVRTECALALGAWGTTEAVGAVIDALDATGDPETRYWFAMALMGFDTPEARGKLQSLEDDPNIYIAAIARQWARARQVTK
jgi:HEAT repeat protein